MTVYFIGAGPGAPDLLTLRAARLLQSARVCLYAGSLVPDEVLAHLPAECDAVNTARMPLDEIVRLIVQADAAGHDVMRLHSGDPSLYSAVAEQVRLLSAHGIEYQLVPGVPAFTAAAASLGRELTVPGVGQSLLITRVSTLSSAMPPGEDLASLARTGVTLALHLAAHQVTEIVAALTPTYGSDCPTATVAFASRPTEQIVRCPLGSLATELNAVGIRRTAVIFVGKSLAAQNFPDSYLYSQARMSYLAQGGHE